uniref:Uncharacterized LOC100186505 n=1 Tax=Ciona intestinalis TaxID=7719 RepID=F6ZWG9_CIOIN|nr:uncharacterized protein LOC100186505 isoform X2 [Ciona intestinalis]|eukprot:XP_009861597.1 uncharacterized protein LOC100186505 isoform X2 [Ciona intestinalis]
MVQESELAEKEKAEEKRSRKISIILPDDENKKKSHLKDDVTLRNKESVTSYSIVNASSRRPRSSTWSARERMGSTVLTKIPIVSYRRLEVAGKKQMLSYTDINIIRRQMRSQKEEIQRQRFRRDYKRTTSDIYRMQLDRTENLTEENELCFKAACVTYLGTSPGARRAVAAQLD